jgi:hypothetical protein
MTIFKANRKFPNPITVNDEPRSHTLALQQIIEALNIGQRRTREVGSSYVRVQELVDVGLIEIVGNQLKLTNTGSAAVAGGASALADLTDVNLTGLTVGDILTYDMYGDWVPVALADLDSAGRHGVWVSAGAMLPSAAGGCQPLANIASAASQPDITTLNFDATTQEYAQFSIRMPKAWNEGNLTFVPVWSHPATTTNFGVVWELQAVAISNDDAIAVAFGTAQSSTDTGGTTNDIYVGPESAAITVGGTPQAEDVVHFRISRVTGNASDTMAVDARLHGITIYMTTDAETDA